MICNGPRSLPGPLTTSQPALSSENLGTEGSSKFSWSDEFIFLELPQGSFGEVQNESLCRVSQELWD